MLDTVEFPGDDADMLGLTCFANLLSMDRQSLRKLGRAEASHRVPLCG